ncbi:MAG: succinate--CoA ligase subunit alpha [Candidatus Sericytochromatia bacterium]
MSILVNKNTKLLVQGITGREGAFHTMKMIESGTQVVAGVTPGKGGQTDSNGVPIFNTVSEAVAKTGANASIIFVPPPFAADAMLEAFDAQLPLVVCITEGVPVHDMVKVYDRLQSSQSRLIGPNCPGLITPGEAKLGIMPAHIFKKGNVGMISRSGTLTYELVAELSSRNLGISTCVGIGGDPIVGTSFLDCLKLFEADPETEIVVMAGEIGGAMEEIAAEYIKEMKTPVIGFISGRTAPPGKRMGHAGAIVSGNKGTAEAKVKALTEANVPVPLRMHEVIDEVEKKLKSLAKV